MRLRNPGFGYQRIAQQIAYTFGLEIDRDVVRRVLAKHFPAGFRRPSGPSWLTSFAHTKDSLWSVDLFRCESILLHSHWVLVVTDVCTRRFIGFGIGREYIDGSRVCRMFNQAVAGGRLPKRVSTDHDLLFRFHRWLANLRILEIEETKSVPHAPMSHPFVERLIGTIRREFLDRTLFWNSLDLHRKLETFKAYYNEVRVHRALNGTTPANRAGEPQSSMANLGNYAWARHCHGLFETPVSAMISNSPPTGSVDTSIYLKRISDQKSPHEVLIFHCRGPVPHPYVLDSVANRGGTIDLHMTWVSPAHLHVTHSGHPDLEFQVVRYWGVEITTQNLSDAAPQAGN
jgi:putative transposase